MNTLNLIPNADDDGDNGWEQHGLDENHNCSYANSIIVHTRAIITIALKVNCLSIRFFVEESDYKRKAALFIIFDINEYQRGYYAIQYRATGRI